MTELYGKENFLSFIDKLVKLVSNSKNVEKEGLLIQKLKILLEQFLLIT